MTVKRTKVGKKTIERLRLEAGGKCANPGCSSHRTHIHHIREWAVYKTHDSAHMIAVCPTCHDDIHHGAITLSDETIYRWKEIIRLGDEIRGQLYIEPGGFTKLLTGTIAIVAPLYLAVFYLSSNNYLRFDIKDDNLLFLNLRMYSYKRKEVLRVTYNHLRLNINPLIEYKEVKGNIQITVPATPDYIPSWVIDLMLLRYPQFVASNRVTVLSMEVVKPGVVRIQGVWAESEEAVVITKENFVFLRSSQQSISFEGDGEDSGFILTARSNNKEAALFAFEKTRRNL